MDNSRGSSSKRRNKPQDQQTQESRSIDRPSSSRSYQNGDQNPASILASSRSSLERLAHLAKYLESSFLPDISSIEEECGTELDREKEIERLSHTVETLTSSKGKELEDLRKENTSLKNGQQDCLQEKERCQTLQAELRLRSEENDARREQEHKKRLQEDKAKSQKHLDTRKVELEAEIMAKVRNAENQSKNLSLENDDLKKSLLEVREELKTEKKRDTLAFKGLEKEYASLAKELEQVKFEFPVEGKPVDYYLLNFQGIHNVIRDTSSRYFSKYSKAIDTEAEHRALRRKNPIFNSISLLDSGSASFVRVCMAQHIISNSLCDHIWQPFLTQTSDPRHADLNRFLNEVSQRLAASRGHGEGAWRALTLRGIDAIAASSSKPRAADIILEEVLDVLQSLISGEEVGRFKEDLESIVNQSISIWELARKDQHRISIQREPDPNDQKHWHIADSTMPQNSTLPAAVTTTNPTPTPLCLFPYISQRSQEGKEVAVHHGSALFPSSYLWTEAMLEKKEYEEEMKRMVQEAKSKVNIRRVSVPASPIGTAEGKSGFMALNKHEYI